MLFKLVPETLQALRPSGLEVGVNRFKTDRSEIPSVLKVDPELERRQIEAVRKIRSSRDNQKVQSALDRLRAAAKGKENVVYPVLDAFEQYATVGEIADVFRSVWGEYHARH